MGSTARRVLAELQYAKRTIFSDALRKMESAERLTINRIVNQLYRKLVKIDHKINKTDVFHLLASIGAFSALLDPEYAGSS